MNFSARVDLGCLDLYFGYETGLERFYLKLVALKVKEEGLDVIMQLGTF